MEARLKHRTVGAIAFAAVAIIVLPVLLDGSSEERERVIASIPEAPRIPVSELTIPDLRERMDASERASSARLPREVVEPVVAEPADVSATDFTLDRNNLPVAWTLQVASFREEDNAVRLRQKLRDSEYHTYVLHADTSDGETFRVFVGPMVDRAALEGIARTIESDLGLKGALKRYRVEEDVGQLGGGKT